MRASHCIDLAPRLQMHNIMINWRETCLFSNILHPLLSGLLRILNFHQKGILLIDDPLLSIRCPCPLLFMNFS